MTKQIEVQDFGASLADDIKKIEQALKNTVVNDHALVVLISDATKVRRDDVRAVLQVMRSMNSSFLK